MKGLLAALPLLLPALAFADVDPRFARLRDAAEPLEGLGAFLNHYIGECGELLAVPFCRAQANTFRKSYRGKKLYMIVTEEVATMLSPGPYQPGAGRYAIHITPLFTAGGYALTHGTPEETDEQGHPVVPQLSVSGTLPEGWNGQRFARLLASRGVRVQVIFTPLDVWSLPKRPGVGKSFGVSARIEAILLTEGRTGLELGLWVDGRDLPRGR